MLHLAGYDDQTPSERTACEKRAVGNEGNWASTSTKKASQNHLRPTLTFLIVLEYAHANCNLIISYRSLAALQSRAIRGASDINFRTSAGKGLPDVYDELVRASEGIAFFAATVVVLAGVASLFYIKNLTTNLSAGLWAGLCWIMLVIVPMTLTRFAGVWIVVTTWWLWRPLIQLVAPVSKGINKCIEVFKAFLS